MPQILFTDALATEYQLLFDTCAVNPGRVREIDHDINIMLANKVVYDAIAGEVHVPWYFVSIVHCMEGSLNFHTHLHNGDPLTARTVQEPAGRPTTGNPPFSFQQSAVDALQFDHLVPLQHTSVPGLLYAFERYNGFGSRAHGIHSPYLWSFSNHYTKGKFIKDHVFDPETISKQTGAGVLLKRVMERGIA